MANKDSPRGLTPVRHIDGSTWNGQLERVNVAADYGTALFVGDAVTSTGSSSTGGVPQVQQTAAGGAIRGVIKDFEPPNKDNLTRRHLPASTGGNALIVSDPTVVFHIQEDSDGGALAATDAGSNCDLVVGSGSTSTGQSAMEIDSSEVTTATAQLRLLGLAQLPGAENAIGNNATWEVLINEHELKSTTGA